MLLSIVNQAAGMGPIDLVAKILGMIIDFIYNMLSKVGIHNAALSIIIFTIIIYALMIPMNYKQQKSQKLMNIVQPEIKKITDKYKGKKDNASMMKQQNEMQAVYDKYGTTPTGGCLTSLLTMLIFLGLYRVVVYMHLYVPEINNLYSEVSKSIVDSGVNFEPILKKIADATSGYKGTGQIDDINRVLYSLKPEQWTELAKEFAGSTNNCVEVISNNSKELINIHSFIFGMNIKYSPKDVMWPGVLIPILALVTQLFSNHQITKKTMQNNSAQDNPMMQSMMMTTKIMPFFSMFICFTMPIGAGIYWVLSGVLRIIQQAIFDKHFDNLDVDELIKANVNKASKKKKSYLQKLMEAQEELNGQQLEEQKSLKDYAHLNSRNYNSSESVESTVGDGTEPKPGSISSYANIMKSSNRK